jgi:hypothetical protein
MSAGISPIAILLNSVSDMGLCSKCGARESVNGNLVLQGNLTGAD